VPDVFVVGDGLDRDERYRSLPCVAQLAWPGGRSAVTIRWRLAIPLAVLLALAGPAAATEPEGTLRKMKETGAIAIGYREAAAPLSFVGSDMSPTGYSIDLCRRVVGAIQSSLGLARLEIRWVKVTPETRVASVVNGAVDLECGSTPHTLARREAVDFSLTTFVDGASLLVRAAAGIRGAGDLSGKRVAVIAGTATESALADWFRASGVRGATVVNVTDDQRGLAALDAGAIDAYASMRTILAGLAATSTDPGTLTLLPDSFSGEPHAFAMRRGDAAFRLAVDRALASLCRTRQVVPIYEKWFGPIARATPLIQSMYRLNSLPE
jgi:ABC-type amino acid transport substrate-binding protein